MPYDDENRAREFSYAGAKAIRGKFNMILSLFDRERMLNPNNTYFILHDKQRNKIFFDFQYFLESHINNNFLDSHKQEKSSLDRLITYYLPIHGYFTPAIILILADIEKNTCYVDKNIIDNVFSQYKYIQKNTQLLSKIFDKKVATSNLSEGKNKELTTRIKNELNAFTEITQKEATISTIQSNLKECQ